MQVEIPVLKGILRQYSLHLSNSVWLQSERWFIDVGCRMKYSVPLPWLTAMWFLTVQVKREWFLQGRKQIGLWNVMFHLMSCLLLFFFLFCFCFILVFWFLMWWRVGKQPWSICIDGTWRESRRLFASSLLPFTLLASFHFFYCAWKQRLSNPVPRSLPSSYKCPRSVCCALLLPWESWAMSLGMRDSSGLWGLFMALLEITWTVAKDS